MPIINRSKGNKLPPKLLDYVKNKINNGVIHLYFGYNMKKYKWNITPYKIDEKSIQLLQNLDIFYLKFDILFIMYIDNKFINKKIPNFFIKANPPFPTDDGPKGI